MRKPFTQRSLCRSLDTAARVLATLVALAIPPVARADACAQPYSQVTGEAAAASISLSGSDGGAGVCESCLQAAAAAWNNACSEDEIPSFAVGGSAPVAASVAFVSGTNPGTIPNCSSTACGCTSLQVENGVITGADVALFESASGTSDCEGSWNSILTHELGHVLGLQDASACSNRIMGNVFAAINSNDCSGADVNFKSGTELNVDRPDDHPCSNPPA